MGRQRDTVKTQQDTVGRQWDTVRTQQHTVGTQLEDRVSRHSRTQLEDSGTQLGHSSTQDAALNKDTA